jgi:hypothetical protein
MKRIALLQSVMLIVLVNALHASPNYWDPKNIINSAEKGNPYWFLHGLTKENVESARHFTTMRQELLSDVNHSVQEFIDYAQTWIKGSYSGKSPEELGYFRWLSPEEIKEYHAAIHLIKNAQTSLRKILATDAMTAEDRDEVMKIVQGPSLQRSHDTQKMMLIGGSHLKQLFPERIKLEQYHQEMCNFLRDILKRPRLSESDSVLTRQALNSLELEFYVAIQDHDVRIYEDLTTTAQPFLTQLLHHTPQELFPHDQTEGSQQFVKNFSQRLNKYLDTLDQQNKFVKDMRIHIVKAEKVIFGKPKRLAS